MDPDPGLPGQPAPRSPELPHLKQRSDPYSASDLPTASGLLPTLDPLPVPGLRSALFCFQPGCLFCFLFLPTAPDLLPALD